MEESDAALAAAFYAEEQAKETAFREKKNRSQMDYELQRGFEASQRLEQEQTSARIYQTRFDDYCASRAQFRSSKVLDLSDFELGPAHLDALVLLLGQLTELEHVTLSFPIQLADAQMALVLSTIPRSHLRGLHVAAFMRSSACPETIAALQVLLKETRGLEWLELIVEPLFRAPPALVFGPALKKLHVFSKLTGPGLQSLAKSLEEASIEDLMLGCASPDNDVDSVNDVCFGLVDVINACQATLETLILGVFPGLASVNVPKLGKAIAGIKMLRRLGIFGFFGTTKQGVVELLSEGLQRHCNSLEELILSTRRHHFKCFELEGLHFPNLRRLHIGAAKKARPSDIVNLVRVCPLTLTVIIF